MPIVYEWVDKIGQLITQKLIPGGYMERQAIVYVTTVDNKTLFHTRKGLSPNSDNATKFKTLNHGLKTARKKYRKELGKNLQSYTSIDFNHAIDTKLIEG